MIVHRDSPFHTFADLRGASWSFNERLSHSGFGITWYRLVEMGRTDGFFGRVIEAGFHDHSIRLVRERKVDASAIDCHVLALAMRDDPLSVIAWMFGRVGVRIGTMPLKLRAIN